MDFKQRIKQLRKEYNLTQEDLAKKVSKTRSAIAGWESEGKEPDHETLSILSEIFDVSIDYLLGKTNDRKQVIVDTKEKADTLAEEIINILVETGELSKEELQSGKIDSERKKKLLLKVKKAIKASQIFEEE